MPNMDITLFTLLSCYEMHYYDRCLLFYYERCQLCCHRITAINSYLCSYHDPQGGGHGKYTIRKNTLRYLAFREPYDRPPNKNWQPAIRLSSLLLKKVQTPPPRRHWHHPSRRRIIGNAPTSATVPIPIAPITPPQSKAHPIPRA